MDRAAPAARLGERLLAGLPEHWRALPECREVLQRVDLHFHDLRREFACSLLESGAVHHVVRDFLGYANISDPVALPCELT